MLTTYFIQPVSLLSTFVDSYILCTSGNDCYNFNSYWPVSNNTCIVIYLGDKAQHNTTNNSATLSGKQNCTIGLSTQPHGFISFTGKFHAFIIHFKVDGFNKLFRIPTHEITDKIFVSQDIFGRHINNFEEQIQQAHTLQQMACITDSFLFSFLHKHKKVNHYSDGITAAADALQKQSANLTIRQCAEKTNMSLRTFERKFKNQVGVSPKVYTRVCRFNEALQLKITQPEQHWASIAYQCGYFDQVHLAKSFKAFTGFAPSDFFQNRSIQNVQMMPITRFLSTDFFNRGYQSPAGLVKPTNNSSEEQFVFIKRNNF